MPSRARFIAEFIRDAWADGAGRPWIGRSWHVVRLLLADISAQRQAPPAAAFSPSPLRSVAMQQLTQDLRLALRGFRTSPSFTFIAVLTLAIGIGASTAVFAVVDAAILRPFPYPDISRIALLYEGNGAGLRMSVDPVDFADWRKSADTFDEIGLYRNTTATITGEAGADRLPAAVVMASIFDTLGIPPLLGRRFSADDDMSAARVVILGERVWRARFGGQPGIIGSTVTLNGQDHIVVGVMPAALRFPSRTTDLWLPFGTIRADLPQARGSHPGLTAIGRIKPGLTLAQAQASMTAIASRLSENYPQTNHGTTALVLSYYESLVSHSRPALLLSLGAVALVLLIGCANLANMSLARGDSRRQELSVRTALGADRRRLIQQLVTEAGVIALVSAAIGAFAAWGLVQAFVASEPATIPRADLIGVDLRALGVASALAIFCTLVVGLLPALRASRADLQSVLRENRRAMTGRGRMRDALVMVEVAVALVLLVGAGLLMKSFTQLMSREFGFSPSGVLSARLTLPARYSTPEAGTAFYRSLVANLASAPGVDAVGLSSAVPLAGGAFESSLLKEGEAFNPAMPRTLATFQLIGGDYFGAIGTRVTAGREFNERDSADGPHVVILDELGAKRMFNGESPVGRRVAFELQHAPAGTTGPSPFVPVFREVVGVVPHVTQYALHGEPDYPQVFLPFTQPPQMQPGTQPRSPSLAIAARMGGSIAAGTATIRRTVAGLDAGIPLYNVRPLSGFVNDANETQRLGGWLFAAVSGIALALAMLGIYGVLSYSVAERTREIGLRIALGATRATIHAQILRQAGAPVLLGLIAGSAGAIAASRYIATLLIDISPSDPVVFAGVAALLGGTAAVAAFIPAHRAARVDPVDALRQ